MRKRNAILLLTLVLFTWKLFRTDWIVTTRYSYHDPHPTPSTSISVQTFTPPVRPLWLPPRPRYYSRSDSWWDQRFFGMGGAGGPIEEPQLHVHWLLILIKLAGGAIIGYLLIALAFRIFTPRPPSEVKVQPIERCEDTLNDTSSQPHFPHRRL